MYTSYIGKKFLNIYNQRKYQNYSAREFFDKIFFKEFFDNQQHLMHVGNSAFFQKPAAKALAGGITTAQAQLKKLHRDIATEVPNMSTFVGYAAKEVTGTTSGQLTNINFNIDAEDMYASWIGQALGVGVSGGFVMLIDKEEILWALFEGWTVYRKFLSQTPSLKDKQIETWNGGWLYHRLSKKYNPLEPMENFIPLTDNVLGKFAIITQKWSTVVFRLAQKYPDSILTVYSYNLSQTNTTLGFINLHLPQVVELFHLRNNIFMNRSKTILNDEQITSLETYYGFKGACKQGSIGLKALEPARLRDFIPDRAGKVKDFKFTDENSYHLFYIYNLWIIAMLNKKELLELAAETASALLQFENTIDDDGKNKNRGKKDLDTLSEQARTSSNIKIFVERITDILEKFKEGGSIFKKLVHQVVQMPADNFPLFITLIRFEYTYQKNQAQ